MLSYLSLVTSGELFGMVSLNVIASRKPAGGAGLGSPTLGLSKNT